MILLRSRIGVRFHGSGACWSILATTALLLGPLAGCSSEAVEPVGGLEPRTVVGRVEGTDVAIAVVSDAERTVGYLCGGPQTLSPWTRWLAGDDARLVGADATWWVEIDEDGLSGTVHSPDALAARWQGTVATDHAGLYTVVDGGCRTGVVVESETVAQGVWCNSQGWLEQVTPVTPITKAGFRVRIELASGQRELEVRRFGDAELALQP